MKFFTDKTTQTNEQGKQNAVIMGRKTWFSIPEKYRPLSNRLNVVLTKSELEIPGAYHVAKSLEDAISFLSDAKMSESVDKIFIIGGEAVYKAALELGFPVRVYLTHIHREFECDTYFPHFPKSKYALAQFQDVPEGVQNESGISFNYEVYVRDAFTPETF